MSDTAQAGLPCIRRVAGRGLPPEAAARRAGLEDVEKLLTTNLTSTCAGRVMLDRSGLTCWFPVSRLKVDTSA